MQNLLLAVVAVGVRAAAVAVVDGAGGGHVQLWTCRIGSVSVVACRAETTAVCRVPHRH